jgi:methylenetetrahydrofolate dehydrogenase (NADP+)/methenyltetrahydrofolate cyclohydrolase
MNVLDGKSCSNQIVEQIADSVSTMINRGQKPPHLAAVLVGENAASQVYVRNKIRLCDKVGFTSSVIRLPETTTEKKLLETVNQLNDDDEIDGFIVQLPLPKNIRADVINLAIAPHKDVDGFHPNNVGRMCLGLNAYLPATPQGILTLLDSYDIDISGKKVAILGRSNIVGRPMSILLSQNRKRGNGTVTVLHSRSKNTKSELRSSDVIIAAIGSPNFITSDMVKPGAVIVDVGINRVEDSSRKRGYRLCGDVDFDGVKNKVGWISPVPGGVGPMTVVSLLINTLKAARKEVYE